MIIIYRSVFINIILFSLLFCSNNNVFAQSKEELLDKRQQKLREIKYTNELLSETRETKKKNYNQLLILQKRIEIREDIIDNIQSQINQLNREIIGINLRINDIRHRIDDIKKDYGELIRHAYRYYSINSKIMFILSSKSFNQAYKRIKYMNQYAEYRKQQVQELKQLQRQLVVKLDDLEKARRDKQDLIANKAAEKTQFLNEKNKKDLLIKNLKSRESELKSELANKRRIAQKLQKEIQRIIELERKRIENSKFKQLTPEQLLIANNFERNRGKLPWPTVRGIITEEFGRHPHAILKGVFVNNNGVDITTTAGSEVRAIFDGVVTKVIAIKGANNTIIIRHGSYLTVYQNLVNILVEKGEKVKTKDPIGYVYNQEDSNKSVLHLEIWNETEKLNPKIWLAGR
jgi:septal ring factor EnvC (AmiA/AmiB activator)